MKYIKQVDDSQNLKHFIIQELKALGIKIPKKKTRTRNDSLELNRQIFGNHLCLLPQVDVLHCGPVPKFLYEASVLLEKHADTEGLFRKSGSVARQKELKQSIEDGQDLIDANPLDLASLVKQFFRELPDPLLTARHHDTFLKAFSLENEELRQAAILLLCLLLPWHHLSTLRFIMLFLRKISAHESQNKMDVQNLAVCLAPNILHANSKSDKMNTTETKLLQIQTNIVEILINSADKIGMVSDVLVEQCHLMSTCFPEEDELDTIGDVISHNDSKNNKKGKKKRSGSFQGLMSNLSTSFSKWRKDSKHNASSVSERSTYSYMSHYDKSSIMMSSNDVLNEFDVAEMTPKMLRKRKADEECVPFSASKKQAILQNMPHMSTLGGTPFTPAMKRGLRGNAELVRTPTIHFSSSGDTVFSGGNTATPSLPRIGGHGGERYLRTASGSSSRKSPNKAGCFSPKTPKNGVRKTVRGFLKRLSGGREVQQAMGIGDGGDKDYVPIIEMNSSRRKSVFRKHRKTPSSPARLVTPLLQNQARSGADSASCASLASSESAPATEEFQGDDAVAKRLAPDLQEEETSATTPVNARNHRRRTSEGGGNLRRGKPNTLKTGLPSPAKRRSLDTRFVSPDKKQVDSVPSTLDTSPILKEDHTSPVTMVTSRLEVTNMDTSTDKLSRQQSASSITSLGLVDQTYIESDHDRAFIHESMCMDSPEIDDIGSSKRSCSSLYTSTTNNTPESAFKKPMAVETEKAPVFQQKIMNKLNQSGESDVSDASGCTVIHNGQPILKSKLRQNMEHTSAIAGTRSLTQTRPNTTTVKQQSQRTASLDSAIDSCGSLSKCASLQSVQSCDSGLSLGERINGSCPNLAQKSDKATSQSDLMEISVPKSAIKYDTDEDCDADDSCVFQRTPSLRISNKVHDMLIKAGVSPKAVIDDASEATVKSNATEKSAGSSCDGQRLVNEKQREKRELAEKHSSPFRFHNSYTRRRTGSPIRIPAIFAKADLEASKYREFAQTALRTSPKPNVKKPSLPISTDIVNAGGVIKARSRLQLGEQKADNSPEFNDPSAGHTPSRLLHKLKYNTVQFPSEGKDNIENTPATPNIKPGLMPSRRFVSKNVSGEHGDIKSSIRTPIKPVKRLQGPSPGARYVKSPKKVGSFSKDRQK